ncbi:serine/threonine-protein kinase ATM-like isoform X2 [Brassica napus]|uniref:serine/threonine-protein kinase ATM-like isoform X2 n=1 Tax=Brassica napus TaxID=3708 RepID=UPI0020786332|nr:serine/threonine-protein kinase ATM-like isoform X2 [Brassica napus]
MKASMEEDDECFPLGGGDKVRKIEVSGGNISLVVDFSGSLTGASSHNAFESNVSCLKENQTQLCLVGNLVWAMTKSKKWWPGEVVGYKADAKESCFMVRYLGEGQLESWCAPSKLRPFKESFERLVSQRNDVGFFVAVEEAMTLLRNSLRLEMTCSCMSERNGKKPARKTKPLILREFSVDRLEPKEFVTQLKNLAECVSSGGILEATVMQSRLSAFYSFCGHKQIPMDLLNQNEARRSFNGSKMEESEFVGSPSVVAGSSRRKFRKEWFRKFVSEVDYVSAREDLVDTSPSDLVSKLKLLAVDSSTCAEETENVGLFEWFFSKFRISVFHDENSYRMQLANMAGLNDLMVAKAAISKSKNVGKSKIEPFCGVSVAGAEQKTSESQKISEKSKTEVTGGVSVANIEQKISESHKNSERSKMEVIGGVSVANTEQKTFELQKNSEKSKIEVVGGVSVADADQKAFESNTRAEKYRTYQRASKPKIPGLKTIKDTISRSDFSSSVANEPSLQGKACIADTLSRPSATHVPDLNSGGNGLASAESDRLQKPETLVPPSALPQKEERPFSMMLNFQAAAAAAAAPRSNYGTSGTGFVSSLTDLERKFTSADLCAKVTGTEKKKRGRKRKNPEAAHATGIPDLNGTTKEPASVPSQAEPTQRRKRRKKEEMPNRSTRGITVLVLKFSSKESMPSKDDLTSTFSAFGPLDASETHVYEELSGAEVAFVSSGDAVEAVKSLDKANPFGENLVSFRLQQKLINVYRNIAPRMPEISHVSPLQKPKNAPISVESMKQNLMMMTAMLDKSGDHLSRETKAKLKSDISALLEKISSMPSSSSSS